MASEEIIIKAALDGHKNCATNWGSLEQPQMSVKMSRDPGGPRDRSCCQGHSEGGVSCTRKCSSTFALWEKQQNWMCDLSNSFPQQTWPSASNSTYELIVSILGILPIWRVLQWARDTLAAVDLIFLFFVQSIQGTTVWQAAWFCPLPENQDKYKVKYTISDFRQV